MWSTLTSKTKLLPFIKIINYILTIFFSYSNFYFQKISFRNPNFLSKYPETYDYPLSTFNLQPRPFAHLRLSVTHRPSKTLAPPQTNAFTHLRLPAPQHLCALNPFATQPLNDLSPCTTQPLRASAPLRPQTLHNICCLLFSIVTYLTISVCILLSI